MKLFVGTNFGHGASVAALNDAGELIFAADEGRLIGVKECDEFPAAGLDALVKQFPFADMLWAEGWHWRKRYLQKGIAVSAKYGFLDLSYFRARLLKETDRMYRGRRASSQWRARLRAPRFTGHHLAHAFSLLPWGLPEKSIIVVSDTTSEAASISIFYWCGRSMKLLREVPYPHSLGAAYHQMAKYVGFSGRTGPGKLMALAGYGQPRWVDELRSITKINQHGFRFDLNRYPAWHRTSAWQRFATRAASRSLREAILGSAGQGEQAPDLARSVQDWFTLSTLDVIKDALGVARDHHGLEVNHIGLAGGAALNCQTNGSIIRNRKALNAEIIVSPWSDDPGTSIGAAGWLFNQITGSLPKPVRDPFLGPYACSGDNSSTPSERDIHTAATVLQAGGIVGLVSGRLEFGPRALGHRCLLGDPRRIEVRDKLNRLKQRPKFMPIAPVVRESDFRLYFCGEGSTIMAWTVPPTPYGLQYLPAAIHANNQARVQVLKDDGTLLGRLLKRFRELTNIGVLLLTSLNGQNEPIAVDLTVAKKIGQKMGIDGIICDSGWCATNPPRAAVSASAAGLSLPSTDVYGLE